MRERYYGKTYWVVLCTKYTEINEFFHQLDSTKQHILDNINDKWIKKAYKRKFKVNNYLSKPFDPVMPQK